MAGGVRETRSLWIGLGAIILVMGAASYFGGFMFTSARPEQLSTGLTNIATIGGVAGGLSLAGTAVLTMAGETMRRLIDDYGAWIRWILFGGYFLTITMSLAAGVAAVFSDQPWIPWLASTAASCIFFGLFVTALFINSAFRWHHYDAGA